MADRPELDFTYSLIDRVFRLSLGEMADFSGAKYDGDFSLTLEQAQRRKHDYIAEQVGIQAGSRVLDLGCGWGPLLNYIRRRGASGVGVTLSKAQVASCRRHGLDVHLRDARRVTGDTFGQFDAVASLGAFEHFCSVEDYAAGHQDQIYGSLFENIAGMLPAGGRLYLQTMVFGPRMIPIDQVSLDAPRDSSAWYLALMQKQFPGSLLPFGQEQIIRRRHTRSAARVEYQRAARLHRDDPTMATALCAAERAQDPAEARARATMADERRLSPRVHLGGQRKQRLLRTRATGALPARVREAELDASADHRGHDRLRSRGYGADTFITRVPQFARPSGVWLDFGGMYSVASQIDVPLGSITAHE